MIALLLEPNETIANIIKTSLEAYGFAIDYDNFMPKLLNYLSIKNYDIIFSTTNTNPASAKIEPFVSQIRSQCPNVPILGIHTQNSLDNKVSFLNAGGDDVICYPFPMREFLARIQALLRRPRANRHNSLKVDTLKINTAQRRIYDKDCELPLCRKEYNILEYMARNKNRTVTRSELMDHVWDYKKMLGSNTVDVHISRIRDKVKNKYIIQTIHGVGYRLNDKK